MSPHHTEIISTLTELYTVLFASGAIPSDLIILPDPATGLHPAGTIASDAALAAGFSQEVVDLFHALPHLDVGRHDRSVELLPSTFPVTYYGNDLDEGYFEARREVLFEEVLPPYAFKLTHNELYGFEFIYNTKTKLVTAWNLMGEAEKNHYSEVPAKPPKEAFGDLIENYRSLNYIKNPMHMDFNPEFFSKSGGIPPEHYSKTEGERWREGYDTWAATRKIKDIYLDCGWDVKARNQTNFRRDEFIRRRDEYWENVVMPLIEK